MSRHLRRMSVVAALVFLFSGCSASLPTDPHGTLDRVDNGTLRVGVTANPPWAEIENGIPTGREPDLIGEFAAQHDATVEWTVASEAVLTADLERGELDVVIGGFLDDTPWVDTAAVTRPYMTTDGPDGPQHHVVLTRMGENALLVAFERFLDEEERS